MPRPRNTPERLWSKVDKSGGPDSCWPWTGWRGTGGYGRFEIDGKSYYAHRAIYLLQHPGSITLSAPENRDDLEFLRHSCDNPPCCNPKHLTPGTHSENVQDMLDRGRQTRYISVESPRAKLSAEDVFYVRLFKKRGATRRAIALLYEVSFCTISSALSGRHYKDV